MLMFMAAVVAAAAAAALVVVAADAAALMDAGGRPDSNADVMARFVYILIHVWASMGDRASQAKRA